MTVRQKGHSKIKSSPSGEKLVSKSILDPLSAKVEHKLNQGRVSGLATGLTVAGQRRTPRV
jgi:hypothetical protein